MSMIVVEILAWWYSHGWVQILKRAKIRNAKVSHLFSVPILVRTLFAPWRRIITYPGASIDAKIRAMGDNMVSRVVGFSVRAMVLFTAGVMLTGSALLAVVQMLLWPLVPVALVVTVFKGVMG